MRSLRRYAALLGVQLRASVLLTLQYRLDFFVEVALTFFWIGAAIVPLVVLFHYRDSVAGWSWTEALMVVAFFNALKGVLNGAIQPSLGGVIEHIRKGTLDFILIKPADAQFLVSTTKFEVARFADVVAGALILAYAMYAGGHVPSLGGVAAALLLLLAAVAILYSLSILVVSLAFRVVKVDNLSYLFASIFDAARWPAEVFRGVVAFLFTFIIPLALMTTYPALAVLDRLSARQALVALTVACAFLAAGRLVWRRSIAGYTSAGG